MLGNIIQLNEDLIKDNLKDLVRNSVEETLNALLDHEAHELAKAEKYERLGERQEYRLAITAATFLRQPIANSQPPRGPISFRYLLSASFHSGSLVNPALSSELLSIRLFSGRTAFVG